MCKSPHRSGPEQQPVKLPTPIPACHSSPEGSARALHHPSSFLPPQPPAPQLLQYWVPLPYGDFKLECMDRPYPWDFYPPYGYYPPLPTRLHHSTLQSVSRNAPSTSTTALAHSPLSPDSSFSFSLQYQSDSDLEESQQIFTSPDAMITTQGMGSLGDSHGWFSELLARMSCSLEISVQQCTDMNQDNIYDHSASCSILPPGIVAYKVCPESNENEVPTLEKGSVKRKLAKVTWGGVPGPTVLYIVADHVPVSRWKEFVRRLGLNENTIERISMEQRHIREAQYEMLGQWRLQAAHGATVEHISNVLNEMELSGCSEAIQEVLRSAPTDVMNDSRYQCGASLSPLENRSDSRFV
ncbi:Tumor necrosis factor receptor superfamily member 1A [Varanus komodoensis]|nr:Tumor necrosis factor receptor superfamily member 1A [Varanus komodoensis]